MESVINRMVKLINWFMSCKYLVCRKYELDNSLNINSMTIPKTDNLYKVKIEMTSQKTR